MKTDITVVLCTFNRCQTLRKALESIVVSQMPRSVSWEILVVDNNSGDRTREVIEEFGRKYPGLIRYLLEPQQGLSFARNAGIREARGDVLAFVDDDVTVGPAWLSNLTRSLRDHAGDWEGAGGRIILQWPAKIPNWLSIEGPMERHAFPGLDQGGEAKKLVGPPFGTNMAFRRTCFEKYGDFRTDLGRSGESLLSGEDTEFGRRLIAAGEQLRYEPDALVFHPVPEDRINKEYFLRWWFDNGRTSAREFPVQPVREMCRLAVWTIRWLAAINPKRRFYAKLVVWEKAGKIRESLRQSRSAKELNRIAPREATKSSSLMS